MLREKTCSIEMWPELSCLISTHLVTTIPIDYRYSSRTSRSILVATSMAYEDRQKFAKRLRAKFEAWRWMLPKFFSAKRKAKLREQFDLAFLLSSEGFSHWWKLKEDIVSIISFVLLFFCAIVGPFISGITWLSGWCQVHEDTPSLRRLFLVKVFFKRSVGTY